MKVENDLNLENANKPFSNVLDNSNTAGRFINTGKRNKESKTELNDTQDVLEKYFYDKTKFSVCLKTYPSNLVGYFLSNKFAKNNTEEVDVIVCKYVMMYINLYPKESHTYFINELTMRLGDLRKNYYDRACQIMSLIVNGESYVSEAIQLNKPTKIVKVNDEKYIEGIRKEVKAEIEIKKPDKIEKYTQYTPRTIQECQNMMRKNKYISASKLCLYYVPILVSKTTNRMLAISSSSLFETVINFYDDRIEDLNMIKINAIASLIAYSYANISSAIFDVVKEGSYINKTILILSMINNLHVIDKPTLIDILVNFCIAYVPNKLTNNIALNFVNKSAAVFDDDPKIACLCQNLTLKIKS